MRLRLVLAFWAVAALAAVATPVTAGIAVLGALALFAASGVAVPWRRLVHLEAFLVLLLLTLPFTLPGEPLLALGPLTASREGLLRAAVLAGKVTASALLIALLIGSAEPLHIGAALRALHLPEPLVRLFVALVRNLGLVRDELRRLDEAMRARAFRPRSNRHTWRSYGWLVGMLLVRAMDRADRVEEAMRLRGYAGRFPRTALPLPGAGDWLAAAGIAAAATALPVWDRL